MRQTDIPPKVRAEVYERDSFDGRACCVYCGNPNDIQIAHYISRGRGGLGIPKNLVCLCTDCHRAMDSGSNIKRMRELKTFVRAYLRTMYWPDWTEKDLVKSRWDE